MNEEMEIDIFRVLSHPLRRKILIFIARKGGASYKDLTQIVPKPGALYHHLRLLGDLIYQDNKKIYRLTKKGERVYEFLITEFFVPEDKSFHKILTPRIYLEQLEGRIAGFFVVLFILSSLTWLISPRLIPIFLIVIELDTVQFNLVVVYLNLLASVLIIKILVRLVYARNISYLEILVKSIPIFILVNLYPLIFEFVGYGVVFISSYLIVQFFAILFAVSAVSVTSRLHLRSALTVVLILHYLSLLIAMCLLGYLPLKL